MVYTSDQLHRANDGFYYGERGEWLVAYVMTRDSDPLDESNFRAIQDYLECANLETAIETSGHWAVGTIYHLLVPDSDESREILRDVTERLADYPVLDEGLYSEMEQDRVAQYWDSCGTWERLRLCKDCDESIFAARALSHELLERAPGVWDALRQ